MELILAVLGAGPMGYFTRTRRAGLWLYLIAWAVVFPIQTVVVFTTTEPGSDDYLYWVFNALFLAIGVALNLLGSALRERRVRARAEAA